MSGVRFPKGCRDHVNCGLGADLGLEAALEAEGFLTAQMHMACQRSLHIMRC